MIRKLFQCVFALVLCPLLVAQQSPPPAVNSGTPQTLPDNPQHSMVDQSRWNRVRTFSQGDKIAVTTRSGETYRCTVTAPSDAGLACSYMRGYPAEQNYEFMRDDILEVRQLHPVRDIAIATGIVSTLAFVGGGRQVGSSFDARVGGVYALVAWAISTPIIVPLVTNSRGHLIYRKPGTRTEFSPWRPAPMGVPPFFPFARRF
jgi:hypothetical protein